MRSLSGGVPPFCTVLLAFVLLCYVPVDAQLGLEYQISFVDMFPPCAQYPFTGKTEEVLLIIKYTVNETEDGSRNYLIDELEQDFTDLPMLKYVAAGADLSYLQKNLEFVNHRVGTTLYNMQSVGGVDVIEGTYEGAKVDFQKYEHMNPEDSDYLNELYQDEMYVFLKFTVTVPTPTSRLPGTEDQPFLLYVHFRNSDHPMEIQFAKTIYPGTASERTFVHGIHRPFHLYEAPDITDYFPVSGPSQGGTQVTVLGSMPYIPFRTMSSAGWTQLGYHQKARGTVNVTMPLIRFSAHTTREITDQTGYVTSVPYTENTYIECETSTTNASFITLPQMLNETDSTRNVSVWISFNRQSWYEISWAVSFTTYDHSRLAYGNVITVSPMREREKPFADKSQFIRPSGVLNALPLFMPGGRRTDAVGVAPDLRRDINKYFVILPQYGKAVPGGTPVTCGSTIRLMHHQTLKLLRAYFSESYVAHEKEVSLNGAVGDGDAGDNWVVNCEENTEHSYAQNWKTFEWDAPFHQRRAHKMIEEQHKYWKADTPFRLWHPHTNTWLSFAQAPISDRICSGCAKAKLTEVSVVRLDGQYDAAILDVRWFVKQMLHTPFECDDGNKARAPTGGSFNSWPKYQRSIRVGDFVAWRDQSGVACDNVGKTRIGYVTQLFQPSGTLIVDQWFALSPEHQWVQHVCSPLPHEALPPVTMPVVKVYGPLQHQWERPGTSPLQHSKFQMRDDLTIIPSKTSRVYVKFHIRHAAISSVTPEFS